MFAVARTKGYEKILAYVRADNQVSLNFHLKLGFCVVGTASRMTRIGGRYIDEVFIEQSP
jgi:L-amino acid N-acyltransferase YncA